MCFSAAASFAAGSIATVVGLGAANSARRSRYRLLAVAPLLFATQQVAEGITWLTFEGTAPVAWRTPATQLFLLIANVVWPIWVPLAVRVAERDDGRRRWLAGLLVTGAIVGLAYLIAAVAHPYSASVVGSHIAYPGGTPWRPLSVILLLYPVAVVVPLLVSSDRLLRWVGVVVFGSLVVARGVYLEAAVSVWCFFAAIISALLAVAIRIGVAAERPTQPNPVTL